MIKSLAKQTSSLTTLDSDQGRRTTDPYHGQLSFETDSNDEFEMPIRTKAELLEEESDFFDIEEDETAFLLTEQSGMPTSTSLNVDKLNMRASVERKL